MAVRRRLGEILLADGTITEIDLGRALAVQAAAPGPRRRLGATLIELGLVDERELARALAAQLGLDVIDLDRQPPETLATSRISGDVARRHDLIPVHQEPDGTLVVAMVDPTDIVALDEVRMTTRAPRVRAVVAIGSQILALQQRYYPASGLGEIQGFDAGDDDDEDDDTAEGDLDAKPIIRLTNTMIVDAMRMRASDIHVEPTRTDVRVRFRVDGILTQVMKIPRPARGPLTSRLKLMGTMDISERRRPQDGRTAMTVHGEPVDIRMSAMPTMHGEKIVMRLLRRGASQLALDELHLAPDVEQLLREALEAPQGILLVTGPTGSGKTTTLYAGLAELATMSRNVLTLEDPIEYELELVNQTQINPRIGFTFAVGMRTVLRQDPDVVMVGEIRDTETAKLAFEAAMTGHLVLSTLHTNDAPSAIVRMAELGVERHLIASSLSVVLAQRLVRLVCEDCAVPDDGLPDAHSLRRLRLDPKVLVTGLRRRGAGCMHCLDTGYRGRISVIEALVVTPRIRDLITDGGSESELRELARVQGLRPMRHDAIIKAMQGLTTFDEVLRATPDDPAVDVTGLVASLAAGEDGLAPHLLPPEEVGQPVRR